MPGHHPLEGCVQLQHVDAGLAQEAERAALGVVAHETGDLGYGQVVPGGDAVDLEPGVRRGDVRDEASRFVSPPEMAPHSAGAAVDLTLVDADGNELDLGTRVNAGQGQSAGACCTSATNIGAEAMANRNTLTAVLSEAGLVNYATEWWHWSWGDRYWALRTNNPTALYGPTEPVAI